MSKKIVIISIIFLSWLNLSAKDYNASLFNIKSDGVTSNTESIQYAIDYISEHGGGRLVFYVGRYLTGSFHLKSNVTIQLNEGAVLVAIQSIYDYFNQNDIHALILGNNLENIGITGKGVIEGNGSGLFKSIVDQVHKEYLNENALKAKPALIYLNDCNNVNVDGIILLDACGNAQVYHKCSNLNISNIIIQNTKIPESKGIVLSNCNGVILNNSYFDVVGEELSYDKTSMNISVKGTINSKGKKLRVTK
jgi:polygalacturonase